MPHCHKKDPAQCQECHACHAKRRWMSPSATPATQNEGGCRQVTPVTQTNDECRQVPRLPRKVPRRHERLRGLRARHQSQPSPKSATPATQSDAGCRNEVRCRQAPRLPHKSAVASGATKGPQANHQSQPRKISSTPATQNKASCHQVPCLPCEGKVDAAQCHACHAKCHGVPGD